MVKKLKGVNKICAGIRSSWNLFDIWISPQQLSKGHQLSYT